jgi:hypothetical protein
MVTRLSGVILPQTRLGWAAVCLVAAFLAIFQISQVIAAGSDSTPWLAFFIIPLALSGLSGASPPLLLPSGVASAEFLSSFRWFSRC